jgi:hypothetical protein
MVSHPSTTPSSQGPEEAPEGNPAPSESIILSVCDHSGQWSRTYAERGYQVLRIDPKHGPNVDQLGRGITEEPTFTGPSSVSMGDGGWGWPMTSGMAAKLLRADPLVFGLPVVGLLMAPPCTDFTVSGSRWWAKKDAEGVTQGSVAIVEQCLSIKDSCKDTLRFWVLENPVGRMRKLVPLVGNPLMAFDPCDYAGLADDPDKEAYTKRTQLYGSFNPNLPLAPRKPVMFEKVSKSGKVLRGSWMWAKLGGKSERTKELRSVTPQGFSRAFAEANP